MEEIVFVTHNKGKAKSAERYFNNLKFSTYDFELDEPRSDDIKEIHYFYGKHPGNLATKIQGIDREEKRKMDGSVEALRIFADWYQENK